MAGRRLEGRCAIVTGGRQGIGQAAARRFLEEGANVVLSDIVGHEESAERLRRETGGAVEAVGADLSSDDAVDALVAAAMERFGQIDIVLNNGAIASELKPMPFEQERSEDWLRIYDVNVVGVFRMCRAVSPYMRAAGGGKIINVASGTAFKGSAGMMHYIASKGAVISITRSLANELGRDNITVNAVSPGFTLTEAVTGSQDLLTSFSPAAIATRFLKRDAMPEDVARVIYFLASDDSGFVTGQIIPADGGAVMH